MGTSSDYLNSPPIWFNANQRCWLWQAALILLPSPFGRQVPAVYELRQFVAAGGLMSYGTNVPDVYRQIGVYADRVLKGEKPGDLPFWNPQSSIWLSICARRKR